MDDVIWQQAMISSRRRVDEVTPGSGELSSEEGTLWRLMEFGLFDQAKTDKPMTGSTRWGIVRWGLSQSSLYFLGR